MDHIESTLHRLVLKHWQHHGACEQVRWCVEHDPDTGTLQCQASPIFQQVFGGEHDGQKVWTGFLFDVTAFASEPEIEIESTTTASVCKSCSVFTPYTSVKGRLNGEPFALWICLGPQPFSPVMEIIDTLAEEVRPFEEPNDS